MNTAVTNIPLDKRVPGALSEQHWYCVVGQPIHHSLSPIMHNEALRLLSPALLNPGLLNPASTSKARRPPSYLALEVSPQELKPAVALMHLRGCLGFNVTVPHKVEVMKHLQRVDPTATAIGAVNTVIREENGWLGTNTDAAGFIRSMEEAGWSAAQTTHAVVLGAGGAARAVVMGLATAGVQHIHVMARREAQAQQLAQQLAPHVQVSLHAHGFETGTLQALFPNCDLLVQSTSATLDSSVASAFARGLPLGELPQHATVVDLVYKPLETTVLAAARSRGLRTVDGLGMLVHQGALALQHWLGDPLPSGPFPMGKVTGTMRDALLGSQEPLENDV